MWKCKNKDCGRVFPVLGRISVEKRGPNFASLDAVRTIVEKPCCPFCESLEFEWVEGPGAAKPATFTGKETES